MARSFALTMGEREIQFEEGDSAHAVFRGPFELRQSGEETARILIFIDPGMSSSP
jgi:hypothetical protein